MTAWLSGSTLQGGMNAVPADEVEAAQAQVHVFASVGQPTLSVTTAIDLSSLPEGPHELRVVAYQGDFVFTQGYAKVTVIRSGFLWFSPAGQNSFALRIAFDVRPAANQVEFGQSMVVVARKNATDPNTSC